MVRKKIRKENKDLAFTINDFNNHGAFNFTKGKKSTPPGF